jgi:hypothetical protein
MFICCLHFTKTGGAVFVYFKLQSLPVDSCIINCRSFGRGLSTKSCQKSKWLQLKQTKSQAILRNTSGIFWSAQFAWKPSNLCLFINVQMDM